MVAHYAHMKNALALVLSSTIVFLSLACRGSDSELLMAVEVQLAMDAITEPRDITVTIPRRGTVYLSGETMTRTEQRRAVEVARSVNGVRDVINDMWLSDAAIVEAVQRALAADSMTASITMDVDSTRGLVRLMSDATNQEERTRAIQLASQVDGVKKVEDRMK